MALITDPTTTQQVSLNKFNISNHKLLISPWNGAGCVDKYGARFMYQLHISVGWDMWEPVAGTLGQGKLADDTHSLQLEGSKGV